MLIIVDEAGDAGLKLSKGSSKFFVVTPVMFKNESEADACDQRITQLRRELKLRSSFEFHFRDTPPSLKREFFKAVAPFNFFYISIIIDKSLIAHQALRPPENFYRYTVGLVFDQAKSYVENAVVVFDGSGSRPFKRELATFLRQQMNEGQIQRIRRVKMQDSKTNNLIQLADMICGAVYHTTKNPSEKTQEFRRLIAHRERSTQIWSRAVTR
jgi:hypothetical protein